MLRPDDITGSWRLLSWRIEYPDGRKPTEPFGPDPIGMLLYAADGGMTATMSRRRRTTLSAPSAMSASEASRAQAFSEYLSYGGRWHLEGDSIVHVIEFSMNPSLIGTVQVREARVAGDELVLAADESDATSGARRRHGIAWRRNHQVSGR